ncbi:MAG TPA: plastocyanin/azurin family copper-binding protein [Candidatus Dormibacteraeota bacterium]|nr:plastocyanin/azurin family copper-binding protein [Candidatus Dormibacteraeota bacterium]
MIQPRSHHRRYSTLIGIAVGGIVLLLAACGTGPIPGGSGSQPTSSSSGSSTSSCSSATALSSVTIDATDTLKFAPDTACLKVGGTVTWKNTGEIAHTTTDTPSLAASAADALLPSGAKAWTHPLSAGASWSLKLTVAGTYKYFCIPHETLGMLGSITVVS